MSLSAETRATEYSKAATGGNWQDVWASPIILSLSKGQRQRAKGAAANEVDEEGPGLFGDDAAGSPQGVAAE
jgi:ribonucleoside-diphosphate reductase beta chain